MEQWQRTWSILFITVWRVRKEEKHEVPLKKLMNELKTHLDPGITVMFH